MVKSVREAEQAIGTINYELTEKQKEGRTFGRSLYVVEDIKAGEEITTKNVRSIRPGYGLHPRHYKEIIGKKAIRDIDFGEPMAFDLID
ncbi:MAG: SAF domain-containing protein [Cytophagales bacterium]